MKISRSRKQHQLYKELIRDLRDLGEYDREQRRYIATKLGESDPRNSNVLTSLGLLGAIGIWFPQVLASALSQNNTLPYTFLIGETACIAVAVAGLDIYLKRNSNIYRIRKTAENERHILKYGRPAQGLEEYTKDKLPF